ncbi:DUF2500 domain-containing protein [Paenibacillus sp. HB172176]|uniref:DUF2500 domain-containing protein n=1 Tax=Paenibacillus sp. HB172176 TaxID=2493690 RepID=UPI00143B2808|nr:DUF2500 domain-containing protein [Paenibacillus sp. HB172176]
MGGGFNPTPGGSSFDLMFSLFPIFFFLVFALIIGGIIFSIVRYARNAKSEEISSYARIISKRMEVSGSSGHHHHGDSGISHSSGSSRTDYYITLEFDNGSRREFLDVKKLYGLVAEGDTGYALTKGEWIVAFERNTGQS